MLLPPHPHGRLARLHQAWTDLPADTRAPLLFAAAAACLPPLLLGAWLATADAPFALQHASGTPAVPATPSGTWASSEGRLLCGTPPPDTLCPAVPNLPHALLQLRALHLLGWACLGTALLRPPLLYAAATAWQESGPGTCLATRSWARPALLLSTAGVVVHTALCYLIATFHPLQGAPDWAAIPTAPPALLCLLHTEILLHSWALMELLPNSERFLWPATAVLCTAALPSFFNHTVVPIRASALASLWVAALQPGSIAWAISPISRMGFFGHSGALLLVGTPLAASLLWSFGVAATVFYVIPGVRPPHVNAFTDFLHRNALEEWLGITVPGFPFHGVPLLALAIKACVCRVASRCTSMPWEEPGNLPLPEVEPWHVDPDMQGVEEGCCDACSDSSGYCSADAAGGADAATAGMDLHLLLGDGSAVAVQAPADATLGWLRSTAAACAGVLGVPGARVKLVGPTPLRGLPGDALADHALEQGCDIEVRVSAPPQDLGQLGEQWRHALSHDDPAAARRAVRAAEAMQGLGCSAHAVRNELCLHLIVTWQAVRTAVALLRTGQGEIWHRLLCCLLESAWGRTLIRSSDALSGRLDKVLGCGLCCGGARFLQLHSCVRGGIFGRAPVWMLSSSFDAFCSRHHSDPAAVADFLESHGFPFDKISTRCDTWCTWASHPVLLCAGVPVWWDYGLLYFLSLACLVASACAVVVLPLALSGPYLGDRDSAWVLDIFLVFTSGCLVWHVSPFFAPLSRCVSRCVKRLLCGGPHGPAMGAVWRHTRTDEL